MPAPGGWAETVIEENRIKESRRKKLRTPAELTDENDFSGKFLSIDDRLYE
jgi:hypothetical protein